MHGNGWNTGQIRDVPKDSSKMTNLFLFQKNLTEMEQKAICNSNIS
jgi:hypothetical protein